MFAVEQTSAAFNPKKHQVVRKPDSDVLKVLMQSAYLFVGNMQNSLLLSRTIK